MPTDKPNPTPVVFVHGLWLHSDSWQPWIDLFNAHGYASSAAGWPGDSATASATRLHGSAVAGYGVTEIADQVAAQINSLPTKPILIGHSMGGLVVQQLLGRDLALAAIAIDPAPIAGVRQMPLSTLRATFPAVVIPFNYWRAVALTQRQFHYAFTNLLPMPEARELYVKYCIPSPARPLFQSALANLNLSSATKVDAANSTRGPLLITAASDDHTIPPSLSRSASQLYRNSSAITELHEFAGRGHSLTIDSGWREVADYCLGWLKDQGL